MKDAKSAVEKDDFDEMKKQHDHLNSLSHKMAEEMYQLQHAG